MRFRWCVFWEAGTGMWNSHVTTLWLGRRNPRQMTWIAEIPASREFPPTFQRNLEKEQLLVTINLRLSHGIANLALAATFGASSHWTQNVEEIYRLHILHFCFEIQFDFTFWWINICQREISQYKQQPWNLMNKKRTWNRQLYRIWSIFMNFDFNVESQHKYTTATKIPICGLRPTYTTKEYWRGLVLEASVVNIQDHNPYSRARLALPHMQLWRPGKLPATPSDPDVRTSRTVVCSSVLI